MKHQDECGTVTLRFNNNFLLTLVNVYNFVARTAQGSRVDHSGPQTQVAYPMTVSAITSSKQKTWSALIAASRFGDQEMLLTAKVLIKKY